MDVVEEKVIADGNDQQKPEKGLWKDLISHSPNKYDKFDTRTQIVFDALREKLKTVGQARDKSEIEIHLEKSESQLEELINFGNELVNNIKGANEQHELLQSRDKTQNKAELGDNLLQEAEISRSQFDEINKKWSEMSSLKEPMAIFEDMQKQRENIDNLLASKNELIDKCQQELKRINNKYYDDQNKMSQDICFLVERIDRQIELLKKSYRKNIHDLQKTINREKDKVLQTAQEKWNTVYEHLTVNEAAKMEMVKEKRDYYAREVEAIRNRQEEITRNTRIRLEKDAEILELEIRKTRANILMNSEKIDYNYQVLQKRNEENIIINNQQKRRVAKFNESIVVLKRKLHELRENNSQAMDKLTMDIQKLHSSINELQTKAENFRKNNKIKLYKVWSINFKEIKLLITRVFDIDRILYEQQLARKWTAPIFDLNELDYTTTPHDSEKNLTKNGDKYSIKKSKAFKAASASSSKAVNSSERQLHDILHKVSERAGFLVEDRLLQILESYTAEEKCLVKIENIFAALNIKDIEVVKSLNKYFEPYSYCPNCKSGLSESALRSLYSLGKYELPVNESNTNNSKTGESPCENHILYMETALVLTALNDFILKELKPGKSGNSETRVLKKKAEIDLLSFDKAQIIAYWQQFASYMTTEQHNIWKSIEHGLNHYLEVLKKRAQIDRECVFLQKQNAELKHLLQKL